MSRDPPGFINIQGSSTNKSSEGATNSSSVQYSGPESSNISNETKPHRRKKSRRRPKSYTNRDNILTNAYTEEDFKHLAPGSAFNTRSLLNNAAEEQDFNTIKEGLKFALGTEKQSSHWIPTDHRDLGSDNSDTEHHDHSGHSDHSDHRQGDTTYDSSPFGDPEDGRSHLSHNSHHLSHDSSHTNHGSSPMTQNSNHLMPNHYSGQGTGPGPTHLEVPSTPLSNRIFNFHNTSGDLESGLGAPSISINNEAPESPGRITNLISRVSDRIAGTGPAAAVASEELTPIKSNLSVSSHPLSRRSSLVNSQERSRSSSRNRSQSSSKNSSRGSTSPRTAYSNTQLPTTLRNPLRNPLSTSVNLSPNDAYSNRGGLGEPDYLSDNSQLDNSSNFNSSPNPFDNLVAFENLPLSDKFIPNTYSSTKISNESHKLNDYLFGNTLKVFSPTSKFRRLCVASLNHKVTNTFFLVLLCLQVILLTYRQWNPMELKGYVAEGNNWADYLLIVINIIYTLEMVAKVVAYGFYDDRIMYEQQGLPYPRNEVRVKIFRGTWVTAIREYLPIIFTRKSKRNKPFESLTKDSLYEFSDSNDIELETHHINDTSDERNDRNDDTDNDNDVSLSNQNVLPQQALKNKNTLLKTLSYNKKIDPFLLRRAYLRNSWHRIDFISIIMFWISLFLSIDRYDVEHNIMIFRALSCLRILRLCNLTKGTSTIMRALKLAMPQLIDVIVFIGCFGLFFALIGVQSFKSSFSRHCVWYNPDDPSDTYLNEDQYCGGYMATDGSFRPYIFANGEHSSSIKGFKCPINSKCETGENPYEGTVSFDNIFNSLELIFVIMSANTFTDLMYMTMHTDSLVACLFFVFGIFFMTVWLLNVFIAIIVSSFNITRTNSIKDKSQRQNEGIFGPVAKPALMNRAIIDEVKSNHMLVRLYYRFEFLFPLAILVDIIAQCFRKSGQSTFGIFTLYKIESGFTVLFLVEILFRFGLYLPKWRLFFKLKRNCFDLFLAVITSIIILGPVRNKLGQAYYWLTVFQIMRCYRIVLMFKVTRDLWLKIFGNLRQLIDLSMFFFLLLFLTSIIYARFFEGCITPDQAEDGDVNFTLQTLPNTFVGLYIITSTENWTDILYNIQGYQDNTAARVFTAILLISWFLLSNMIVLNAFIAVIADTLIVPEAEKKRKQLFQFIENITASIQHVDNESGVLSKYKDKFFKRKGVKEELQLAVVNLLLSGTAVNEFLDDDDLKGTNDSDELNQLPKNRFKRFVMVSHKRLANMLDNPFKPKNTKLGVEVADFDPTNYAKNILIERNHLIDKQNKFLRENPTYNDVFYIMGPRHKVRRFCQRIVTSSHGERIDGVEPYKRISVIFAVLMFLATIALVITACYITPLYRSRVVDEYGLYDWTFWLDVGFLVTFSIECAIRILADGFIFTPNAYSRSSWNQIDFIVLLSLWVETIAYLTSSGDLSRFVRGFKALRALRILTISETAKSNFHNTIISGIWKIVSAAIMSLCLLIPFSVWGLNIFNGRLGYCLDGESTSSECFNEFKAEVFNWEVTSPNVYAEPLLYFDTFSRSFSTLFEITSLEGWSDLLVNLMSSTGVGTVPEPFASPINGFFLILYNFIGIVFILTLFISVIIHNYSLTTGRAYMTLDQRSWYQIKQFLLQVQPSKRHGNQSELSPIKKFCYQMTVMKNKFWNSLLNFVLFLHVIALLLEKYPSSNALNVLRVVIYIMDSVLFTVNAVMLLIGQGFKVFVRNKWYVFNMLISVGALITTIIGLFVSEQSAFTNINKLFLVATLFFVIPRSDRLSQFLRFASASVPNLLSLLFTWLVLFLVFAIALNQIFGTTKIGPNGSDDLNVRTVPKALILLFRCSFGEGWNYIMDDYKLEPPFCYSSANLKVTDCGNKQYAYILFIAWNLISMYIFLNMFISLILDSFSYIMNKGDYAKLVERSEIRGFKRVWQKLDPEGSGFIQPQDLPKFLHNLEGIFSFHFYHGELSIPELSHKWFKRNDPQNPYDITVKHSAIQQTIDSWDIEKIRNRRKVYEHFIEEAMLNMELNREPGISFRRILIQLPLYKAFDSSRCLNLIDFLERRLLDQKVQKRLHQNKVYETISAYICRWKYVENKKKGIKDNHLNFDRELKRRSYLSGERSPVQQQYFDDEFEEDFGSHDQILGLGLGGSRGNGGHEVGQGFGDSKTSGYQEYDSSDQDSSENDQLMGKSGIYVPKSPLNLNKKPTSPRLGKPLPPKLFIHLPHDTNSDPYNQDAAGFSMDPQSRNSLDSQPHSTVEISEVGETLKDSAWGEALEDFRKHNKDE